MAFSGLHVVFGYGGGQGSERGPLPILGPAVAAETLATAGTTTIAAPGRHRYHGRPIVSLRSSADAWIVIGPNPADPAVATTTRRLLLANIEAEIFVEGGDKVRWSAA